MMLAELLWPFSGLCEPKSSTQADWASLLVARCQRVNTPDKHPILHIEPLHPSGPKGSLPSWKLLNHIDTQQPFPGSLFVGNLGTGVYNEIVPQVPFRWAGPGRQNQRCAKLTVTLQEPLRSTLSVDPSMESLEEADHFSQRIAIESHPEVPNSPFKHNVTIWNPSENLPHDLQSKKVSQSYCKVLPSWKCSLRSQLWGCYRQPPAGTLMLMSLGLSVAALLFTSEELLSPWWLMITWAYYVANDTILYMLGCAGDSRKPLYLYVGNIFEILSANI